MSLSTITTVSIPDGKDGDFLTLAEVAAILRVPVNTLRWWRQSGDGPHFFKIGHHLVTTIVTSGPDRRQNESNPAVG